MHARGTGYCCHKHAPSFAVRVAAEVRKHWRWHAMKALACGALAAVLVMLMR